MSLSKHIKLLSLNPIIVDNLIRVGGRIGQSYLPFEQKQNPSNKRTFSVNLISIR